VRGDKPNLKTVEGGLRKAPAMPDTLADEMRAEWIEIAADLTGRGLLTTSALGVLETYCGALWMARQCRREIAAAGPIVRNKDGVPRPHPAAAMLAKANDTVARLAYELGISAAGRNLPTIKAATNAADSDADPLAEFDI
jgi:P27 family predicted phage terminase small subunit